jgi:tape measure domain-containing protein
MSGVIIDIDTNAESAKRDLREINKSLASLINSSKNTGKSLGQISPDSFKKLSYNTNQVSDSLGKLSNNSKQSTKSLKETSTTAGMLANAMNTVKTAAIALGTGFLAIKGISAFNKVADDLTNVQNRLKLVIKDTDKLLVTQRQLFNIGRETRTEFASTVNTFTDFSASLESSGIASSRLNNVMRTLNKGIALSGSSVEGVKGALMQLGQGIGSGTLRGEELNAVLEQMKYVGQGLSRELGFTVGQLRDFASQGKLTTEVVIRALEKMSDRTAKDFGDTSATAAQAVQQMSEAVGYFFGQINQRTGATAGFAKRIMAIGDVFATGADTIFAKSYLLTQSIRNFVTNLDMFDAADLVVKGVIDLKISPLDAYEKYKVYNSMKDKLESLKSFFGTKPDFQLETQVETNGFFAQFTSDSKDINAAGKQITQLQGVMNNLKRLGTAAGDAVGISFSNIARLVPRVIGPLAQTIDTVQYSIATTTADLNAAVYDAVIPFGRALENINQRLSLFANGDNKLERAWVDLFNSRSLVELTGNLEHLNVVRKQLRWDDKSFLGREMVRSIRGASYGFQSMLIELGLIDNQLIRIRDTRLDRLVMYFSNIGRVVTRLYQDVFATTFEPIAIRIFQGLKLAGQTFFDALSETFNATTGGWLAEGFINGFVNGTQAIFDFWENFESGKVTVNSIFGAPFVAYVKGTLGKTLKDMGNFIGSFFGTLGRAISEGLSDSVFGAAFKSLSTGIEKVIDFVARMFSKLKDSLASVHRFDVSDLFSIDTSSLAAAGDYIIAMFQRIMNKTGELASSVFAKVRKFCTMVKDEFFEVYDEVVGHSYWPDTIDEINSYTDNLVGSENRVSKFGVKIKKLFSDVYESLVAMGIGAGGTIADFTVRLTKIDVGDTLTSLRDNVIGIVGAGLLLAFAPNAQLKLVALSYFTGLLNNSLGGAFSVFAEVAGQSIGKMTGILASSVLDGVTTGLSLATDAVPAFVKSFAQNVIPQSDVVLKAFDFVPVLTNSLLGSIAVIAGAWALFSKSGGKTVKDIIFGKEAKGKKAGQDGIVDYVKAMFPSLAGAGIGEGLISTLFPRKKLAAAGALALSSAMLDSISIFEALQVGLPLLAFAMLGKDNGAGIARQAIFVVEGIYRSIFNTFKDKAIAGAGPNSIIARLLTPSDYKPEKGRIRRAIDDVYDTALGYAHNAQANADKFGKKQISFADMFAKGVGAGNASSVGPVIPKQIKSMTDSLQELLGSVLEVKLPSNGGTIGAALASMSTMFATTLTATKATLLSFKAVLLKVFSAGWAGIVGAISLLTDGLKGLFALLSSKFILFSLLAVVLTGTAFAASDAGTAFGVVATNGTELLKTLGKITLAIATMGVAYRAFVAYSEGKSLFASVKAGTYVPEAYDAALQKFRSKQAVATEGDVASAVTAAKRKLARQSLVAEKATIFASEADRFAFRKAAEERNSAILNRFQQTQQKKSQENALGGMAAFEANFLKSQQRVDKISSSKTTIGAGLAGAGFYFKDVFSGAMDSIRRFKASLKGDVLDTSPWAVFAEKVGGVLSKAFSIEPATMVQLKAAFATTLAGIQSLSAGSIGLGISQLFSGIAGSLGGFFALIKGAFAGLFAGVGSLVGLLKNLLGFFASIGKALWSLLKPLLLIIRPFVKIVAIGAAILSTVGALGIWLFGPGNTFIDNLEWAYDKTKAIFGLQASTNGGRKLELNKEIGGKIDVGDQKVDFSAALRGLDYSKMSEKQYKIAAETAKETKDAFKNLDTLFYKQGKFTDENLKEISRIRNEQKDILLRLPQKESESFQGSTSAFNTSIVSTETSFFDMLRNLTGWKPVLKETVHEISAFQSSLTYLGDTLTSWPAIIGATIGAFFGPIGIVIGTAIGSLISVLGDGIMAGLNWIGRAIADTEFYKGAAKLATQAGEGISAAADATSTAVSDLGDRISKAASDFMKSLENTPTQFAKDAQARIKNATGELGNYSTALGGGQQSELQKSFDDATDAASRYATLLQQGFRGDNADSLADFTKQLEKSRVEYEKTMKAYEAITARLNPLAKALALTKKITDEQKNLFESSKTLFDYDFGKDNKEFIGGRDDMDEIGGYLDIVRNLQKELTTTYDLAERRRITLDIETVKQQMTALGDFVKGSGFLNQDIEIKAKLTGDFASSANLKELFFRSPEAYKALDGLSREYTSTMADINAITTDTPIENISALIAKIAELRIAAVQSLPNTNIFSQINAQIQSMGGTALNTNSFAGISDAGFKQLGEQAKAVQVLKIELDELYSKGASPQAQVAKLKMLDNATRDYLASVDQVKAAGLKDIVTDKSLGNATKAYTVAKQLGVEIPDGIRASSSAMSRWAAIQVDMAETQIKINQLIAAGVAGSDAQVAQLGQHLVDMQKEISVMSDTSVFSMDSLIGKLQETGLAVTDINFSRLSSGAQSSLASIGIRLEALSKKLSDSSASGLAGGALKSIIAERQALLVKAREQLIDAMYNTGDGISTALNNVGVSEMSQIANIAEDKIKILLGIDKQLQMAKFKVADASDLSSYLSAVKEVAVLEKQSARAAAESTATFATRAASINEIFSTDLTDTNFSKMTSGLFVSLSSYAAQLKIDMGEAVTNGVTSAGESISSVFDRLAEATRTGAYVSFFANFQKDTEASLTNGAQSAFDKLSNVLEGFDLSFDNFASIPDDLRRSFDAQSVALDKYKAALNLPGLTSEMSAILNQTGKPIQDILDQFTVEFESTTGKSLGDSFKTPLEQNTAAILAQTAALVADVNGRAGKMVLPVTDITAGAGIGSNTTVSTEALRRPGKEAATLKSQVGDAAIAASKTLKDRLMATVQTTGAAFDTKALALANDDQLKAALSTASTLSDKQKQLQQAIQTNMPTGQLQQQVIVLQDVLSDMSNAITDGALKVREAGKSFASSVTSDFNTAFSDMLKGKSDDEEGVFSTFFNSIADSISNSIIDTFTAGLLDPLTGDNGIITKGLGSIGETLFAGAGNIFGGLFGGKSEGAPEGESSTPGLLGGIGGSIAGAFGAGESGGAGGCMCGVGATITDSLKETTATQVASQEGFFSSLESTFTEGLGGLGDMLGKAWQGLSSSLGGLLGGGGGGGGFDLFGSILSIGGSLAGGYFSGGGAAASSMAQGASAAGYSGAAFDSWVKNASSAVRAATGGYIKGPGTGTSDSITAMLSNGEYVINAKAAAKNMGLLDAINYGKMPKFAEGGLVSTAMITPPTMTNVIPTTVAGGQQQQVFNLHITGDVSRQTKSTIMQMLPQIASGVNSHNKEKNIKR